MEDAGLAAAGAIKQKYHVRQPLFTWCGYSE